MTEILIQAHNPNTGTYETIDREPGTAAYLATAELSATDLGCEPGTLYRLVLIDDQDREIDVREVRATGPAPARVTERHELEAWLGDDHGLTEDQVGELLRIANTIEEELAGEDEADVREAALIGAYRVLRDPSAQTVDELGGDLTRARADVTRARADLLRARVTADRAMAAVRYAAVVAIPGDVVSENAFASRSGVDRMTVRKWLGKR